MHYLQQNTIKKRKEKEGILKIRKQTNRYSIFLFELIEAIKDLAASIDVIFLEL